MSRTFTEEAIVLKAYDVGEADRFCLLLTLEHGKLAARARAVRKLKSRFGGSVLPLQHVQLQLTEGSAGHLITGAVCLHTNENCRTHLGSYTSALEIVELLLAILPDNESVSEIFYLTRDTFRRYTDSFSPLVLPAFKLKLLALLGGFPSVRQSVCSHQPLSSDVLQFSPRYHGFCLKYEDDSVVSLSEEASYFLRTIDSLSLAELPVLSQSCIDEIITLVKSLSEAHSTMMSAPSKVLPLLVGSSATPT